MEIIYLYSNENKSFVQQWKCTICTTMEMHYLYSNGNKLFVQKWKWIDSLFVDQNNCFIFQYSLFLRGWANKRLLCFENQIPIFEIYACFCFKFFYTDHLPQHHKIFRRLRLLKKIEWISNSKKIRIGCKGVHIQSLPSAPSKCNMQMIPYKI